MKNSAAPFFRPDPNDAKLCDKCGQHEETVGSRRVITIGRESRTVRWKFCDECAAIVVEESRGTPAETAALAAAAEDRKEAKTSNGVIIAPANTASSRCLRNKMPEPPADADFVFDFPDDGSEVFVKPQNSAAREYLEASLAGSPPRWIGGALIVKDMSVVPLAHILIAAGFNVVSEERASQ